MIRNRRPGRVLEWRAARATALRYREQLGELERRAREARERRAH